MTMLTGARLAPYEIVSAIGAGGMGEVFRARDTKLNHDVAIKVLPAAFADDPERLARFTREAQTLASLNHPNVGAIYGVEDVPAAGGADAGSRALVMELVEGEDLSVQIARGPIPLAEALLIARQIAKALEAAHEQGIVHRDLKPANIKVRTDGRVKVLDFGLAKAMDPVGASSSDPNTSHSPTLTHQGTSAGIIIGTAAYMSPEQAKGGKGVLYTENGASSVWDEARIRVIPLAGGEPKVVVPKGYFGRYVSSGHIVYVQQGTLFAVPFDLDRLEVTGPAVPVVEGIAVDPSEGEAKLALSSEGTLVHVPGGIADGDSPIEWMTRDGKTLPLRPAKANWKNPRFSPDGTKLAFDTHDGKQFDIWVYEWGRDTLTQMTFDTGDDLMPVWTPDGRRIVFASDRAKPGIRNLYWINADCTGDVIRLTDSPEDQFAYSWHPNGRLLSVGPRRPNTGWDLTLLPMEPDAHGGLASGRPIVFLSTPGGEINPMFSPDGRWIVYASSTGGERRDIYVRPHPGPGGPWRISTEGGSYPHWSPTTRELLFLNEDRVMTAPYEVVGDSFRAGKPQAWSPRSLRLPNSGYAYAPHPDGKRLAVAPPEERGRTSRTSSCSSPTSATT